MNPLLALTTLLHPDTRMYLAADTAAGIVAARSFFVALLLDHRYVKYYESRTTGECLC